MIKFITGILMVVLGVVSGLYVGIYWCLVLGIANIINALHTQTVDGYAIGLNVVRIVFAGVLGWGFFYILVIPGVLLAGSGADEM